MASYSLVAKRILLSLGLVALVVGCGDDDDGNIDARPGTVDGGGGADGPGAVSFHVTLNVATEVPTCANAAAGATGEATVTVSADGTEVEVTDFTFSGLSSDVTMAHIHVGDPGVAGNILLMFDNLTSPINQTFTAADYQTPAGAPPTFADFVTMLRASATTPHFYLNVHTDDCGAGEIRGNIE